MSELGIFGALRDALPGLRRRLAARSRALMLLALALPSASALAGAGQANIVGGESQIAAPGNQLPLEITVRNDATFPQDLRVFIQFDSTGGAFLNSGLTTVDIPNVGAAQTRTVTVTLGPSAGNVSITSCAYDSFGACIGGTQDFTGAATATLSGLSSNANVDQGDTIQVQVEALNGTTVPFSSIPVTYSVTGPASPPSFSTTSNYMAPATLNLVIDANAPGGSIVTVTAERTDVSPRPPAVVYMYTVNNYQLTQVSPPDGTTAQAGSIVTLVVDARFNNAAPDDVMASRTITWEIIQDPSTNSRLEGGLTTTTTTVGEPGPTLSSIDLTIGAPNTTNGTIIVRATAFGPISGPGPSGNEQIVEFVIDPFDVLTVTGSSGDNQSAAVGAAPTNPLVVDVRRNGLGDSGQTIDWSVSPANGVTFAGGASTAQSTVDVNGLASIAITSVNTTGPITITAAHSQDPSVFETFTITGTPAVLAVSVASGDNQTAAVGTPLPSPLVVNVTRNGTASAGEQINWSVSPAGAVTFTGGASTATSSSDGTGAASISVTSVNTAGAITITATHALDSTAFATFSATGTNPVLGFDTPSGGNQFAPPNQPFPQPLRLRTTRNGAAEAGALIDWSVSPAGGLILSSNQTTTDVNGFTQINVTAGSTGGTYTVFARRNDDPGTVFTFTLTVVDKRLIKPSTGSGDGQTAFAGQPVAQPLVAVATLNGNPESGVTVNWTVLSGDATITATTNPTDAAGRSTAQVTFGPTEGTVTVQAQRADVPTQVQVYTLTATSTRTLEKPAVGSGDGQTGATLSTLPQRLVVIARNNGVVAPGVTVLWSVVGGSATLSNSQTVTGADGSTSVQVTFGSTPGTVTVRATRADDSNASSTFVLTSTSNVAPTLSLEKPAGSGDGTTAPVGSNVTLTARAVIGATPQSGIEVLWELVSGSARLGSTRGFTDDMGLVSTVVTLGPNAGPVTVRAIRTDSGATQTYQLTATGVVAGAVLQVLDGNNQTGQPGATARPLQVRYSSGGQNIANAVVNWQVVSGSATLAASSSLTNAEGVAEVGLVFGSTPGDIVVRATAGDASTQFTLRVAAPGVLLQLISGNRQTGPIGSRAPLPIEVEVSDGLGAPISGRTIQWTVISGSATLDSAETVSGPQGLSLQGFRFGNVAGPIRIRAQLPGVQPPMFVDIEATSFVPTLSIVSGNNQSAAAGAALPQDFVVAIAGPAGSSLAGATIRWQVTAGGGTLASATSVTGNDGRASNRLTLGDSGQQTVTASIDGGPSVTFTASIAAPAGALTIFSGNNQTLPTRTDSAPLVVELKNTAGVPIRGASLVWTADNAQLRSVRTTTDDLGQSSNIAQVLLPGAARVTVVLEGASGTSGSTVVFNLTGGVANIPQLGALEETIGGAIDNLCPALVALSNPTPEQIDLRARCLELVNNAGDHPDQVEVALDELREDVALAQANAALLTASTQFDNLKTRIAALRSGSRGADLGGLAIANSSGVMPLSFLPSAVVQAEEGTEGGSEAEAEVGSDFSRWGFFASGIIGRGEQEEGQVTPEYDFDTTGITAGVDYRVNDQWIVGASLGFNRQDTQLRGDSGDIDTDGWSVSGYTTWYRENNWYLDGVLTFGSNDYDLSRRIVYDIVGAGGGLTHVDQLAEASTSGDVVSTALSFGRDFNKGAWNFGPYMRATYTRVEFDGYEEELAGGVGSGLGLAVEARALKSMTGVLGGKVTYTLSRDWGILMPHAQLEWEHEFKDDPQRVVTRFLHDPTGTRVGLTGDDIDTDYYNIGFGLSALFPGGRSAFLYYEHLAGSEGLSQDNLSIGVRIEF